ncbi:transporter substrate-binding domain-containing protein [Uliginosibacterium sp. H3]|uniref:Transporter substrate-binding domain-containing protein n=1 Tax=Uliginosibacterium silvisoli TaxID=3114758 RepID=A0ABU6K654_9RHOO|nr:transporter substrate-binding domain-containing protein [Uliginosibacterium sp. H3]
MWRSAWCALSLLTLASSASHAETVSVVSPDYWCPYSCKAGSPREGYIVDVLRQILERHGHVLRYENENYARALQEARQGRYTLITTVYPEEAPGFSFTHEPIARASYCFYTRVGNPWRYTGPASLEHVRIGVIKGYSYGPQLNKLIQGKPDSFDLQTGDALTSRLAAMVFMSRLDGFIEDDNVVRHLLATQPQIQLKESGCFAQDFTYVAVSPRFGNSRELAELIDKELRSLRKSGQLKEILSRYGLTDWAPPRR